MERDRWEAGAPAVRLCRISDLRGPGPFAASARGEELVVLRSAERLKAFEGRCPHQGALLAEGELVGDELVCRNHRWRFDVATGERRDGPGCLRPCPLEVRDGELFARPPGPVGRASAAGRLRRIEDLPGPRRLPLVGNLLAIDLDRMHQVLERWAVRYGPAYRVDFGPRRTVVLSDAALIERALRERPETYRRFSVIEVVFRELGLAGVFSAEGIDWRPLRKLSMEALAPPHLRSFYPALRTVAERLHRRWMRSARLGLEVDLQEDFKRFTVDVTTLLAFGHDADTLEQDGDVLQRKLELVFPGMNRRLFAAVPLWRLVKLPAERRLERALGEVFDLLRDLLSATRARLSADPARSTRPETFLEAMASARDDAGEPFSDGVILGNAIQMLLAGEDTTALSLCWAVHECCDAPRAVALLEREADRVLGGAVVPEDFAAAGRLEGAGAVASETLRLRLVAPLVFIEANREAVLGDLGLAKGQQVCLLMRQPGLSAEHFADPQAFRPERWLEPPAGAHEASALMPFGSGPRLCPGRQLALLEMRVALATLFRSFAVERVGTREEVEERFAFTMGPRGLRVRLRERSARGGAPAANR